MKKNIMILLSLILIVVGLIFLIQEFYLPREEIYYKYSPTDFIEPSEIFIRCYENKDCIKVKGSVCPVTSTCVNKNYLQEYDSEIEKSAGTPLEADCPGMDIKDNYECFCVNNSCKLVS